MRVVGFLVAAMFIYAAGALIVGATFAAKVVFGIGLVILLTIPALLGGFVGLIIALGGLYTYLHFLDPRQFPF